MRAAELKRIERYARAMAHDFTICRATGEIGDSHTTHCNTLYCSIYPILFRAHIDGRVIAKSIGKSKPEIET